MRFVNLPTKLVFISFLSFCGFCTPDKAILQDNPYSDWAQSSAWNDFPVQAENWEKRILPLKKEWKEGLDRLNQIDGIDLLVSEAKTPAWLGEPSIRRFPSVIDSLFQKYLKGIVFVQNLGSTGVTVIVRDNQGNPKGGIVFLDVTYLDKPINDWATLKERTAFHIALDEDLNLKLADEKENSKVGTYEFILLHEFGHIFSVVMGIAPDFSLKKRDFSLYPFYKDIWDSDVDSPFDHTILAERKKLRFYGKPELVLFPEGFHFYKKLKNTPFVTLYAAGNADDTFAEAFVSYVHCLLMKRPYQVEIRKSGKTIFKAKNGIEEESGRRPREFIANLLRKEAR